MTNGTPVNWTKERDAIVRKFWMDPKVSGPEIAAMLGLEPHAVAYRATAGLKLGPKVMPNFDWSEANVERLKTMVAAGESAAQIARTFGITRNAVIGKIHRMGLRFCRPAKPGKVAPPKTPKVAKAKPTPPPVAIRVARPAPLPTPKPPPTQPPQLRATFPNARPLADLQRDECRWPVGADPGPGNGHLRLFCGEPVGEGEGSYCPACRPRSLQTQRSPAQKEADADRAARMKARFGGLPNRNTDLFRNRGAA